MVVDGLIGSMSQRFRVSVVALTDHLAKHASSPNSKYTLQQVMLARVQRQH